jgi:hypothetical protein
MLKLADVHERFAKRVLHLVFRIVRVPQNGKSQFGAGSAVAPDQFTERTGIACLRQ